MKIKKLFLPTFILIPIATAVSCDMFVQKKVVKKSDEIKVVNFKKNMIDWHLSGFEGTATVAPTISNKNIKILSVSRKSGLSNHDSVILKLQTLPNYIFSNNTNKKDVTLTVLGLSNHEQQINWSDSLLNWTASGEDGTGFISVTTSNTHFSISAISGNNHFNSGETASVTLTANDGWKFGSGSQSSSTKVVTWTVPKLPRHRQIINFSLTDLTWSFTGKNGSGSIAITSSNSNFIIGAIPNNGTFSNNETVSIVLTANPGFVFGDKSSTKTVTNTVSGLIEGNDPNEIQKRDFNSLKRIIGSKTTYHSKKENYKASDIAKGLANSSDLAVETGLDFSSLNLKTKLIIKATGTPDGVVNIKITLHTEGATDANPPFISIKILTNSDAEVNRLLHNTVFTDKVREEIINLSGEISEEVRRLDWNPKHTNENATQMKNRMSTWYGVQEEFGGNFLSIIKKYPLATAKLNLEIFGNDINVIKISPNFLAKGSIRSGAGSTLATDSVERYVQWINGFKMSKKGVHYKGDHHKPGDMIIVDDSFHDAHPNWNFYFQGKFGKNYDFSRLKVAWRGMLSTYRNSNNEERQFTERNFTWPNISWDSLEIIESNAFSNLIKIPYNWRFPKLKIIKSAAFAIIEEMGSETGRSLSNLQSIGANSFRIKDKAPDGTDFSGIKFLGQFTFASLHNIDNLNFDNLLVTDESPFTNIFEIRDNYTFPKLRLINKGGFSFRKMPNGLKFPALEEVSSSWGKGLGSIFTDWNTMNKYWTLSQIDTSNLKIVGPSAFSGITSIPPKGIWPNVEFIDHMAFDLSPGPWLDGTFPKLKHVRGNVTGSITRIANDMKKYRGMFSWMKTDEQALKFYNKSHGTNFTMDKINKQKKWADKINQLQVK